ncbi:MAG: hypothetical protein D6679_07910 [Candidatus Hydrogenedentota bacterium]|nr:MAG: hypothetical protein D6679_07910 [Candidatus Hydrogenedentota bacterium]
MPDLQVCERYPLRPWFLDVDASEQKFVFGISRAETEGHVGFRKVGGTVFPKGRTEIGFYWRGFRVKEGIKDPWEAVSRFLWRKYGRPLFQQGQPSKIPLDRYVETAYGWAFNRWEKIVWREFQMGETKVGACRLIVTASDSPNSPGKRPSWEKDSIWNQAWFSSLRSASGLYRYARRTGNVALKERACMTKELALSAPQRAEGIFPSVFLASDRYSEDGVQSWEEGRWSNSDRVPAERGITREWYHVLDTSWTALQVVRWYRELEGDERLLRYAKRYADFPLERQEEKGFFPAWLHPETLEPAKILFESPETSLSVTFLLELADQKTGRGEAYRKAALKGMDAVIDEIIPDGRWEDFETYWSCSPFGREEYYGKKIERSGMYKQ